MRPRPSAFAIPALTALLLSPACPERAPREAGPFALSLLAVGDTGKPAAPLAALDPGRAVAAAMAAEDARVPADALVLLGDNFYPSGLSEDSVKDRLRENLVGPFCRFVELSMRGAGSLRDACPEADARHPVPIHALLGNHDWERPESPKLQRERIREYVRNWRMPEDAAEVRELAGGVSLVLLDSTRLVRDGEADPLANALRRARGPFRVVASHHPMAATGRAYSRRFARLARAALERAAVPVHVFLSGHEHNLQAITWEGRWPPLHVVAGGGSDTREVRSGDPGRRYAEESLGFARVDLTRSPDPRLEVTVFEVPAPPLPSLARPAARFAVTKDGRVAEITAPDAGGR
jgi:3',5'-cyclic AMP phosphodiesterase CpdA